MPPEEARAETDDGEVDMPDAEPAQEDRDSAKSDDEMDAMLKERTPTPEFSLYVVFG